MNSPKPPDCAAIASQAVLRPAAVVAVLAGKGTLPLLHPCLAALARSEGLAGMRIAPGSLAVLLLAEDAAALPTAIVPAPDYPFPLRVETGPADAWEAALRANAWAEVLGMAETPVLLTDTRHPVAPRWAHGLMASLRDGADLVLRRSPPWTWLGAGPAVPLALSSRALRAMGAYPARSWGRLRRAGLRIVAA
jgi:hypothetical protein